jgi:hypothetical protein
MDVLAQELKMDPVELRLKNFVPPEKFTYLCPLGWNYDSGNYKAAMDVALEKIGYYELRKEQEEKRSKGGLMGIGVSSFILLKFAYVLGKQSKDVKTYIFSTVLVEITGLLRARRISDALRMLSEITMGWSGGTKIGGSLREFNSRYAALLSRKTVFVILSDGWDTGEPAELAGEMKKVRRRVARNAAQQRTLHRRSLARKRIRSLRQIPSAAWRSMPVDQAINLNTKADRSISVAPAANGLLTSDQKAFCRKEFRSCRIKRVSGWIRWLWRRPRAAWKLLPGEVLSLWWYLSRSLVQIDEPFAILSSP